MSPVELKNSYVALSILGVEGHSTAHLAPLGGVPLGVAVAGGVVGAWSGGGRPLPAVTHGVVEHLAHLTATHHLSGLRHLATLT